MCFFIPRSLINLDYLGGGEKVDTKGFDKYIDFSFFAVNLGYSKSDYDNLTPTEKVFIYKAYEDKIIGEQIRMYNACFTAFYNCNRPKGKRALQLIKKKNTTDINVNEKVNIKEQIKDIEKIEKENGKKWVDLIYSANNIRR